MAESFDLVVAVVRYPCLLIDTCVLISEFNRPYGLFKKFNRPKRRN